MFVRCAAVRMLAATSCKKAVLKAAASAKLKGGTSRVLVRPGIEAFAITATPHDGSGASPNGAAPERNGLFMSAAFACCGRKGRRDEDAHRFSDLWSSRLFSASLTTRL